VRGSTSEYGPKRRKTTSAPVSAIGGLSGLVMLVLSFVELDPQKKSLSRQNSPQRLKCCRAIWQASSPGKQTLQTSGLTV